MRAVQENLVKKWSEEDVPKEVESEEYEYYYEEDEEATNSK